MLLANQVTPAGAVVLPDFDFETYSEAGYDWNPETQKWQKLPGARDYGIFATGSAVYAEHPSTEILMLAYDLKDGCGARQWVPDMPPPDDLFRYLAAGGLIEAHNCGFEYRIWQNVAVKKLGWPPIRLDQLRDSAEKCRAHALPGALAKAAAVVGGVQKDKEGTRLIKKFSVPRNPTKTDPRTRIYLAEEPVDGPLFLGYNVTDIEAEASLSQAVPDLHPDELAFALATREMNHRGVAVDLPAIRACVSILEQAYARYNVELQTITGGAVERASQGARLMGWLAAQGIHTKSLDADHRKDLLDREDLPPHARRAIELVDLIGSAGVKKVYTMLRMANEQGRLEDLFIFCGARTGRDAGADAQPQNLVKAGPKLRWCENDGCHRPYGTHLDACPHCGTSAAFSEEKGWSWEGVDHVLEIIELGSLELVEHFFGDAQLAISGCIRGLFIAGPGKDFICSDYSSIEAVVTAMLAGEQWRIDAFHRKEDIYLASAAQMTKKSPQFYIDYYAQHGEKHPDRQKIGKPAELGLGFGGWVNAWYQFDKSGTFPEAEVKQNIIAWRDASPAIVELWGGQVRGKPWAPERSEMYGLEGAAISAVLNPGTCYAHRGISYGVKNDVLYCRLLSGRLLAYHKPRLYPSDRWEGQLRLTFWGWNSNPSMGPVGWVEIETYGGRLTENVVQATARDFMRDAVIRAEAKGYPIVLRVHDELVAEVPEGFGTIEEFEEIMGELPTWAQGWPIRAAGGWRGKRYRKD